MGPRSVRNCLGFRDAEDSKVRFQLVKPVQRITIRTQISWNRGDASDGLLEHATQGLTIHYTDMDSKPDDASGVVILHLEHPNASVTSSIHKKISRATIGCPSCV